MLFRKNKIKRTLPRKIGNAIIGFFLSVFILLIILFGFSQTSTFRDILRNKILDAANSSLNANLQIDEIDGTLFTHLLIKNIVLKKDDKAILKSKKIEVAINPFYILLKNIKITRFLIDSTQLSINQLKNGEWNINNILLPDSSNTDSIKTANIEKENITSEKDFPFLINLSNFEVRNLSFNLKKYSFLNSDEKYDTLNFDDISVNNFNLKLNVIADINKNNYKIAINSLSLNPNLNKFTLRNLSGEFIVENNSVEANNLTVITDSSMINLSAKINGLSIFEPIDINNFKDYPINFSLVAQPINACDLSSFIQPLDFMNGGIKITLNGNGKFSDFNFKSKLSIDKTKLNIAGSLANLGTNKELQIIADFTNSDVKYSEIDSFLKGLDLPKYPELYIKNMNVYYSGEPLKFNADGDAEIDGGKLTFKSYMDIYPELIKYDYSFTTENIDLSSSLGIFSNLNSEVYLSGEGFDPEKSSTNLNMKITNSKIDNYQIDSLNAKLHTVDKIVDLIIDTKSDSLKSFIEGKLDLASTENPIYNLKGNFENLNLTTFTNDSTLNSSLNFTFDINGRSLDIDKTEGSFNLNFHNSKIGSNNFDSLYFNIELSKIDSMRLISFSSDILDFNISGYFSMIETFNLLEYQYRKIAYSISEKMNELNPIASSIDSSNTLNELIADNSYSQKDLYLDYDFNFKDFKLIAALLNKDRIEISGSGYGYFENTKKDFSVSSTIDLDWLFLFKDKDVFHIANVKGGFDIGSDNSLYSFDNILGSFSLDADNISSSITLNNTVADIVFNQSKAFVNVETKINNQYKTGIEGYISFVDSLETFKLSHLFFDYNNYYWENQDSILIQNNPSNFKIDNFNLFNNNSSITLNGELKNKSKQDFLLKINNVDGKLLGERVFGGGENTPNSDIDLSLRIGGTKSLPIYNLNFSISDISYRNATLGSLYGNLVYEDFNLNTDIAFIDTLNSSNNDKLLTLLGNIPINLSPTETPKDNGEIELEFVTNNFNLASLGSIIPTVNNQTGLINSDVKILGSLDNLKYSGFMSTQNVKFNSGLTNMDYALSLNLDFLDHKIELKNSYLKNISGTNYPGKINFSGDILTQGLSLETINILMNGNLALLSNSSQETSPNFFGDLVIQSEDQWNYKYLNGISSFKGTILLMNTNLNFIPPESSYSVTNSDFKYIFLSDSTDTDLKRIKYEQLISSIASLKREREESSIPSNFDLDVTLKAKDIAKVSITLSKVLNQKLIADITGTIRLQNKENRLTSIGQFDILPSSMFTFYKTFNAEGNIKFASDIANPILNLTSTYTADYINPRNADAEPEKTAVKIKINDSVQSLLTNLKTGENPLDMKIYSGVQNIEYDIPNPKYNNLDAMYFILFGTFSNETEKASLASSAGMSVLGSTITSVLNAQFGDLVNNFNINQTGKSTRINISGRYQQIRYSVGGTVEEMNDWSQANAKLEYLFSPQFIIRVERKDPVISSSYNTNKINEFGVMYRFTF